jgi:hypothetical protein
MDIVEIISSIFSGQDLIVRFALVILIALYGLYALIVAIQISNLNRVVHQVGSSGVLNFLAILHFGLTLALLVIAVLSL